MEIILVVVAVYQIISLLFFIDARSFLSKVLFKVVPFMSALFLIVYATVQKGWVTF